MLNKDFYTTYEARDKLFVSHSTVIEWIKAGKLKAVKTLGGHRRIPKEELEKFVRKNNMTIEPGEKNNNKILIVDDDHTICVGLKEMLEAKGFSVEIASDGFEAGVMAIQSMPALIILDLKMRGLDGFSACKLLKANPHLRHIRILVLTGYPSKENLDHIMRLGADQCLAKPVDQAKLLKAIKQLVKR